MVKREKLKNHCNIVEHLEPTNTPHLYCYGASGSDQIIETL